MTYHHYNTPANLYMYSNILKFGINTPPSQWHTTTIARHRQQEGTSSSSLSKGWGRGTTLPGEAAAQYEGHNQDSSTSCIITQPPLQDTTSKKRGSAAAASLSNKGRGAPPYRGR